MSLLCLFTAKIIGRAATVRKSNLFSTQSCRYISSKIQSKQSTLGVNKEWSSEIEAIMDIDAKLLDATKLQLLRVFDAGVSSVLPAVLIENKVRRECDSLVINGESYPISCDVYLVGFGKAVAGMAYVMERLLGPRLKRGIISVPRTSKCTKVKSPQLESLQGHTEEQCQHLQVLKRSAVIEYREAADNNHPDEASLENTEKIVELVEGLGEKDTLIVLISGGGSALLFQPKAPVNVETKRDLCKSLQNAGASITELNCMRKQLSVVKAGGLAKIAHPAKVIALILSDVVGDPLDAIASGPTCPVLSCSNGESSQQVAIDILQKYNLYKKLEADVMTLLTEPEELAVDENALIEDGKFMHVDNIIIGNNATALQAASQFAKKLDMESIVLSNLVEGDVKNVSYAYAKLTRLICHLLEKSFPTKEAFFDEIQSKNVDIILKINEEKFEEIHEVLTKSRVGKGILLLAGGEPTVVVEGSGQGGRNQELALRFSLDWLSEIAKDPLLAKYFVLFLSAGTDGQDGPTDATGAFGHPGFRPKLSKIQKELLEKQKVTLIPDELQDIQSQLKHIEEMLPENVLKNNNTYHFYSNFEDGQYLVKTGLTGTNVMDLHFIYLKKRSCGCDIQTFFGKNSNEKESKPKKKFGDCPSTTNIW